MKARLILLAFGVVLVWAIAGLTFLRLEETRRRDALAFQLLRIQDQAQLVALTERPESISEEFKTVGWVLRHEGVSSNGELSWNLLHGSKPGDPDVQKILDSVRNSRLNRGTFAFSQGAEPGTWGIGFAAKDNRYYIAGAKLTPFPRDWLALRPILMLCAAASSALILLALSIRWVELYLARPRKV